jgi:hypothetical protein
MRPMKWHLHLNIWESIQSGGKMKIVLFDSLHYQLSNVIPMLGWAPWLSYMWPSHQDKEMDKGIKGFSFPLQCEQESEKQDEL